METKKNRESKSLVISSYPTYEEWKPIDAKIIIVFLIILSVLILPMRNGNNKKSGVIKPPLYVLILPMRNGNFITPFNIKCLWYFVLILPMRNGNTE